MTAALTWAIILLVVGLIIVLVEAFVPSGGLLGVLAGACLLTSIGLAFSQGMGTGLLFLAIVLVSVPTVFAIGMHYLPSTPIGRKLVLMPPQQDEVDPATERDREMQSMIGRVGRTITPLLPSGLTEIEGRRVDTTAEGMSIEAGVLVRVTDVQGKRVIVRKIETDQLNA